MCRCFCCGKLLGEHAIFVNLVDPNGSTRRSNIRPACAEHADA
jgi:DNA-directed RNA polymerase subunit N (RpoN/RPB10)